MPVSTMSRSKKYLESLGYTVDPCERKIRFRGIVIRKDMWGFGDLIFMGHGEIGLCQSTVTGEIQKRVQKIFGLKEAKTWLENNGKILVHGWKKEGPARKRKLWTVTSVEIVLDEEETKARWTESRVKPA